MSATPRLYVAPDLIEGGAVLLDGDQAHYLTRVMRLGAGDPVRVFNGRHGEWEASLSASTKSTATLQLGPRVRAQASVPDIWLLFAPLKKARTDFVVEKAVELGAAEIRPVLTERTDAETVRVDRLQRLAIEAAEQTERLDVPPIRDAAKLVPVLNSWDAARVLLFADEAGDDAERPWGGEAGRARPADEVLRSLPDGPAAILIGPEGGFSGAERAHLRKQAFVRPVSLGPRILRAETAALAMLALWQSIRGDWRG
ncbi:MAG: 16S rRNA (uracil(1498)-N(3))-methyltransferase [Hyphomonadaceae bacterium]